MNKYQFDLRQTRRGAIGFKPITESQMRQKPHHGYVDILRPTDADPSVLRNFASWVPEHVRPPQCSHCLRWRNRNETFKCDECEEVKGLKAYAPFPQPTLKFSKFGSKMIKHPQEGWKALSTPGYEAEQIPLCKFCVAQDAVQSAGDQRVQALAIRCPAHTGDLNILEGEITEPLPVWANLQQEARGHETWEIDASSHADDPPHLRRLFHEKQYPPRNPNYPNPPTLQHEGGGLIDELLEPSFEWEYAATKLGRKDTRFEIASRTGTKTENQAIAIDDLLKQHSSDKWIVLPPYTVDALDVDDFARNVHGPGKIVVPLSITKIPGAPPSALHATLLWREGDGDMLKYWDPHGARRPGMNENENYYTPVEPLSVYQGKAPSCSTWGLYAVHKHILKDLPPGLPIEPVVQTWRAKEADFFTPEQEAQLEANERGLFDYIYDTYNPRPLYT